MSSILLDFRNLLELFSQLGNLVPHRLDLGVLLLHFGVLSLISGLKLCIPVLKPLDLLDLSRQLLSESLTLIATYRLTNLKLPNLLMELTNPL